MRRRTRSSMLHSHMNVVPYIDVMLVLLVIFMVTAPMFTPGVINLPSVGKSAQVDQKPIEINIDKDGNYSINSNGKVTTSSFNNLVNQVLSLGGATTPIIIAADREIQYDKVIQVVDKLYTSGIKKVALVVKQKNG